MESTESHAESRPSRERKRQKKRTRAALLAAASDLLAAGHHPSVQDVADAAQVSRATAYRYFPTREDLLLEVPLDRDAPSPDELFSGGGPTDAEDRVALVQNALFDLARDHESEFRMFLRSSMTRALRASDDDVVVRGARRIDLIDAALEAMPVGVTPAERDRLRNALSLVVGIESLVVMRDVLGLSYAGARDAGEWAARSLVRAATAAAE
jgi:AcrR family transcriptional regulator